jgi:hypothetical protein
MSPINNPNSERHTAVNGNNQGFTDLVTCLEVFSHEDITAAREKYPSDDGTVMEIEPLLQPSPHYQDIPSDPLSRVPQAWETGKSGQGISQGPGMIPARENDTVWRAKDELASTAESISKAGEEGNWFRRCRWRGRQQGHRRCACTRMKIIVFLVKFALLAVILVWLFRHKFHGKVRYFSTSHFFTFGRQVSSCLAKHFEGFLALEP